MAKKKNCWEYKKCGRQPGGPNINSLGICPAATDSISNGLNNGQNGGRICWAVSGTFCDGKVQGTFAEKKTYCMECKFFKLVAQNEGSRRFTLMKPNQHYNNIYRIFLYLM